MNSTAQAWEIAREIAARQGTGSREWYGLAHYILTLPERIEVSEEPQTEENEMNELIPLQTTEFNGETQRTVNARDLYAFLESERQFSNWITYQIEAFGFTQGIDYLVKNNFVLDATAFGGKRKTIDYYLTIDMAKELAMVERSAKGKEARLYFIECERIAKQQMQSLSPAELILAQAQQLVAIERSQRQLEQRQARTEQRLDQIETAADHFTVIGWHRYAKQSGSLPLPDAARMGKQASKYCIDNCVSMGQVPDPRFGTVHTYPKWVLDELFASATVN